MKKSLLFCAAIAASFLFMGHASATTNIANYACPAPGSYDVGRFPNGQTATKWCSNYVDQAVLECNAKPQCTALPPPSCNRNYLAQAPKSNIFLKNAICLAECKKHDLPGTYDPSQCTASSAAVVSCENEWQDYADHC